MTKSAARSDRSDPRGHQAEAPWRIPPAGWKQILRRTWQQTWIDNPSFGGLSDSIDPIAGANDGTGVMVIQARPVRRRLRDVPRFAPVKGGTYCFLPGLTALRCLAGA